MLRCKPFRTAAEVRLSIARGSWTCEPGALPGTHYKLESTRAIINSGQHERRLRRGGRRSGRFRPRGRGARSSLSLARARVARALPRHVATDAVPGR